MLQSRSIRRSALIDQLGEALTGAGNHFFADTSFLIAAASLSPAARDELARWLAGLGERFHVPAWVAHEVSGKIASDTGVFTPMAKAAGDTITAVEAMQAEARRYLDDGRASSFPGRPDRVAVLSSLDRVAQPLLEQARRLKRASKTLEEATEWVIGLVNGAVLPSDIYTGLPQLEAEYAARLIGGHPPGYRDKSKAERRREDDNRYGDLIIWREIVEFARSARLSGVVLLTNDNKQDWVYTPPAILDDEGHALTNEARGGLKVILPLPLLCHELAGASGGAKLTMANLGMVAQMLHRVGLDAQNLFSAYQPISIVLPRDPPEAAEEPGEVEEAAGEGEAAPVVEVTVDSVPDLALLVASLAGPDVEAAASSGASLRRLIQAGPDPGQIPEVAQGLLAGAENGIEAATILIREIVTEALSIEPEARIRLLGELMAGLYYRPDGKLRDRPFGIALPDLFSVQKLAELRPAIAELNARIGPSKSYFLATPDPAAPMLSLSVSVERDDAGQSRLRGIYFGEMPLLEDVGQGSERSLMRLAGGATEAPAGVLRRVLAEYFRVPEGQLDLGIARFERIAWDDLTGLIDWGVDKGLRLR
jgi:hypothetical protein